MPRSLPSFLVAVVILAACVLAFGRARADAPPAPDLAAQVAALGAALRLEAVRGDYLEAYTAYLEASIDADAASARRHHLFLAWLVKPGATVESAWQHAREDAPSADAEAIKAAEAASQAVRAVGRTRQALRLAREAAGK